MQTISAPSETPTRGQEGGVGAMNGEKGEAGVSVSLWVQWTLHKLSFVMFGKDKASAAAPEQLGKSITVNVVIFAVH